MRAHRVDQGSAATAATLAVGCCRGDGTAGSGLERAQAAAGLRALITGQVRCTVEAASRAREQRTGQKWLAAGTQDTGGLKAGEGLEYGWK